MATPTAEPQTGFQRRAFAGRFVPARANLYQFLGMLAANGLIGLLLRVVGFGGTLGQNIVYSQCIGLCIFGLCHLAFACSPRGSLLRWGLVLAAILLGSAIGQLAAGLLTGTGGPLWSDHASRAEFIGIFFGTLGAIGFYLRERYRNLEAELQARELQRTEAERRGLEAHLKMLQAQIEPHFLFNTLANLAGLIEADPKLASRLLEALNRYLRASLKRTRADGGTLGDELDLLGAYLEVFRIRLGPRLDYSLAVPEPLRGLAFPPMLLQPLVENAVRHGIEPRVAGGRIDIAAVRRDGTLQLTVRDTGAGLAAEPGHGLGLENIRARVAALFGASGSLEIAEHAGGGVLATLRLPA